MADISQARVGELIRKLVEILKSAPEGLHASEALAKLERAVVLTPYEAGSYPSGDRRFEKIVRFSTVGLVKAGWMVKQKGIWTVTEEGLSAYRNLPNAEQFNREANRLYRVWRRGVDVAAEEPGDVVVDKAAAISLEEAEESASKQVNAFLAAMPPYEFQTLVGELLTAMGYHIGWDAPPGKDGGIDLLAFNDPLGAKPPRIKVQVKRNAGSSRIDVYGLRSFMALLGEGDVGVYVALSGFTRDAELEARQSNRQLTLIDAGGLVELWTAHHERLGDSARRRLPLKPVWFLAGDQ